MASAIDIIPAPHEKISEFTKNRTGGKSADHDDILRKLALRQDFKEAIASLRRKYGN